MLEVLVGVSILLLIAILAIQLVVLRRRTEVDLGPIETRLETVEKGGERIERGLRDEIARSRAEAAKLAKGQREELAQALKAMNDTIGLQLAKLTESGQTASKHLREEVMGALKGFNDSLLKGIGQLGENQKGQLEVFAVNLNALTESNQAGARQLREEIASGLKGFNDTNLKSMTDWSALQKSQFEGFSANLIRLTESNEKKFEALRTAIEMKLTQIQEDNAKKLDEMRKTVDEKLQDTLQKRLAESFTLVSGRLEAVQKGLGEMQNLASGVGDLKKVLSNVKTRGTWGEVQLGNLLEQVLSPEQYAKNVATKKESAERVEFAIRLPGRDGQEDDVVWLPIDAKYPTEDYQRLVDASEKADATAVEAASRQLEAALKSSAATIHEKYIDPPGTTDFAIMFLPYEGLYAEALRRPGLAEQLQAKHRVVLAGPMTLAALLNSLQMGFRTLAIQQRSSEVWQVLEAVKTEFSKFGDVLKKVQSKLQEASKTIEDEVGRRTRAIERKLRDVEALPSPEAQKLLGIERMPDVVKGEEDED